MSILATLLASALTLALAPASQEAVPRPVLRDGATVRGEITDESPEVHPPRLTGIYVAPGQRLERRVTLPEPGPGPPGFVPIAAEGGKLFWLQDRELGLGEYAEFLNDPPIRARTASSPAPILYPREPSQPGSYLLRTAEGRFEIPWHYDPLTPAFSIDAGDAQAYVDWLNDRAVSSGEPWTYALPTLVELDRVRRWVAGGS